jgi:MoaA/NifB/PqqE/SkfB family radical SAM enzyme
MQLPDTFCSVPWVNIQAEASGGVTPCCLIQIRTIKDTGERYNLKDDTLEEAFNNQYMTNLRRRFLNGEKPEECSQCWRQEAAGMTSKRLFSKKYVMPRCHDVDWNNIENAKIKMLDLKLGNICNLKCRICTSLASSSIAAEDLAQLPAAEKKSHEAYQRLKFGQWPRKSDSRFWQNLRDLLPKIEFIEFSGGEPFLIQEHFDLLKYAVEQGLSKNISLHYNTNGTVDPNEDSWVWQHFKSVHIAFSIDNVGKRYEYERYGADWQEVNDNISWISTYKQHDGVNLTTQLCFTVNIQNVYYLDELLEWAKTKQFNSIHFNMLVEPQAMCIGNMTQAAQKLVVDKLKTMSLPDENHQKELTGIIKFIEDSKPVSGREFNKTMLEKDQIRNQNFSETHPEIAQAMGYKFIPRSSTTKKSTITIIPDVDPVPPDQYTVVTPTGRLKRKKQKFIDAEQT